MSQPGPEDAAARYDIGIDRFMWGSDYPHLSFGDKSSVELFNLLSRWTDDENVRKMILTDNPARLFGF